MKVLRIVAAGGCLGLLAGCAAAPYRPAGYSTDQVLRGLNDLRLTCRALSAGVINAGVPVQVEFHTGRSQRAYFYAFNSMNDTVVLSSKPAPIGEGGKVYDLTRLISLRSLAEGQHPSQPRPAFHDYENDLLTQ